MNATERARLWRAANPERYRATAKAYRARTREKRAAYMRAYVEENRERHYARNRAWNKANPGPKSAARRRGQAAKLQRTPRWLTDADHASMRGQYAMAALMTKLVGVPYHVDHIVPLRGAAASGLHVPANLRVIRGAENMRKGNRVEVAA